MSAPGAPAPVRKRVQVHGRVHGVGFRASCARRATSLGVSGTVANLADGTVEAVFEGSAEAVEAMVAWCRQGPPMATVRSVVVDSETPVGQRGFAVA